MKFSSPAKKAARLPSCPSCPERVSQRQPHEPVPDNTCAEQGEQDDEQQATPARKYSRPEGGYPQEWNPTSQPTKSPKLPMKSLKSVSSPASVLHTGSGRRSVY